MCNAERYIAQLAHDCRPAMLVPKQSPCHFQNTYREAVAVPVVAAVAGAAAVAAARVFVAASVFAAALPVR